ncbi:unnamed protein product [Arabidopsis halleri]
MCTMSRVVYVLMGGGIYLGTEGKLRLGSFTVAPITRRTKLTVPKEPNLRTAERSERHRSKVSSETEQIVASSSKRHIRNKNINLEPPVSTSLPKTNTPRSQDFQAFRFRTSLRAKERSSNAKTDAIQENDANKSRTLVQLL